MRVVDEHADQIIANVGRRIAEVRRALELTQQEAAERLKMPLKNFQALEAGKNITIRTLVRIARGLGVPTRALFEPASPVTRRRGRPRIG